MQYPSRFFWNPKDSADAPRTDVKWRGESEKNENSVNPRYMSKKSILWAPLGGGIMCCPHPIWNFRHDKLKKLKTARDSVLVMVNHPSGANSEPAGSGLYRFSREVRDGWFRPLELTQKSLIFHKKLHGHKKKYLKSKFHGHEHLSESFLDVFKATDQNLKNVWTVIPHYTSFFCDFRIFWPFSRLFRHCSKNLVFEPHRNF